MSKTNDTPPIDKYNALFAHSSRRDHSHNTVHFSSSERRLSPIINQPLLHVFYRLYAYPAKTI